jgi:hypothetical protein
VIQVETLQPPEWIEQNHAQLGASVPLPLELEEMGLRHGIKARVEANEPCAAVERGPGRVVLTTVNHLSNDVWELSVADVEGRVQTIYPTGFHKFYSRSRHRWFSAAELTTGEQLEGIAGRAVVRALTRVPGIHRVYNMTVEDEHTYRVSLLGVLVHNNGCLDPPSSPRVGGQTVENKMGNMVHVDTLNGGTGTQLPTKTQAMYPETEFFFRPRFMKGPDVEYIRGKHPSQYEGSTWLPQNNYGDWKPEGQRLSKFLYEQKIGKLPSNTQRLPYDSNGEPAWGPKPGGS